MTGFDVTSVELQYCGAQLTRLATEVRTELQALGSDVDALLRSWRGHAADGFAQGWQEWRLGARDVIDGLAADSAALAAAGRSYATTEQGVSGQFTP